MIVLVSKWKKTIKNQLNEVHNLIDFVKKFNIRNGDLVLRENSEKAIIITFPKVKNKCYPKKYSHKKNIM